MVTMKKLLSLVLLLLSVHAAFASQNSTTLPTISPYAGLTMLNNINSAFNTFQSNFSGASAPSTCVNYQFWTDTTNKVVKFTPDCTNWYPVGYYNGGWVAMSNGFQQVAVTSTGSSNAYVVAYSPAITAYVTGQVYSFITNFQNTGSATVNINTVGAITLKKLGGTNLASADLGSGAAVQCVYDGTNCQVISQLSQGATGTVTSVGCGTGLTGGTFTTSGTCALATALPNGTTATTQTAGDTSNDVATDNFVSTAVSGISAGASTANTYTYTSSGTYTHCANVKWVDVQIVTAGGAGCTGAGGAGGNGGTTSFASLISGTGAPGCNNSSSNAITGGVLQAYVGTLNYGLAGTGSGGNGTQGVYGENVFNASSLTSSMTVTVGAGGSSGGSGSNPGGNGFVSVREFCS